MMARLWLWSVTIAVAWAREYRMAYIGHNGSSSFYWPNNIAAIFMALDRIEAEGILGSNNSIKLFPDVNFCEGPKEGMAAFVRLHEIEHIDAFIGIGCSSDLVYAGYLASFWNLPMISQASQSPVLANKDVYPTLVRLLPPYNKLGLAMKEIIAHFGWKKLFIFSDSNSVCTYASDATIERMAEIGVAVVGWIHYGVELDEGKVNEWFALIKEKARIIFICGSDKDETRIMLRARMLNMTSSEYVYITPLYRAYQPVPQPWLQADPENASILKEAMQALIQIAIPSQDEHTEFRLEYTERMAGAPWYMKDIHAGPYAAVLYDATYLYALTLGEFLQSGADPRNGTHFVEHAKTINFSGMSGYVALDTNAERQPTYSLYCLKPDSNVATVFAEVILSAHATEKKLRMLDSDIWRTLDGLPPADTPLCGFRGELCTQDKEQVNFKVASGVVGALLSVVTVVAVLIFFERRRKWERELQQMMWRINFSDLRILHAGLFGLNLSEIALYKGHVVVVKSVNLSVIIIKRSDQIELKMMWSLCHENINQFIGACVDSPNICLVSPYCYRGSLEDILADSMINLDNVFKYSFILDIIKGMEYIHNSALKSHGKLKSSNCLVDSRWILKITDFDPHALRRCTQRDSSEDGVYTTLLWTAPEHLINYALDATGTPSGDVYSFGIILQEVLYRAPPYFFDHMMLVHSSKEIVIRVKNSEKPPYRPDCPALSDHVNSDMLDVMRRCWDESAVSRPSFALLKRVVDGMHNMGSLSIVDNMFYKLERYSDNMEKLVVDRTKELMAEKRRTDQILCQILPTNVADRLMKGLPVEPEYMEDVTICFSNIVDFETLSAETDPVHMVHLLNTFYEMMDTLATQYNVYTVRVV